MPRDRRPTFADSREFGVMAARRRSAHPRSAIAGRLDARTRVRSADLESALSVCGLRRATAEPATGLTSGGPIRRAPLAFYSPAPFPAALRECSTGPE